MNCFTVGIDASAPDENQAEPVLKLGVVELRDRSTTPDPAVGDTAAAFAAPAKKK